MSQKEYDYNELARMLDDDQDNLSNGHRLAEWLMKKNDYQPRRRRIFMDFVPNRLSLNIDVAEFEVPINEVQAQQEESIVVQDDDVLQNTELNQCIEQNLTAAGEHVPNKENEPLAPEKNEMQPDKILPTGFFERLQPSFKFSPNCFSTPNSALTRQIYTIPQATSATQKISTNAFAATTLSKEKIKVPEQENQQEKEHKQQEEEQKEEEQQRHVPSPPRTEEIRVFGETIGELMNDERCEGRLNIQKLPAEKTQEAEKTHNNNNNNKNKNLNESEKNINSSIKTAKRNLNFDNENKSKNNALTPCRDERVEMPQIININISLHQASEPNREELLENNNNNDVLPNTQEPCTQDMLTAAREMLTPIKEKENSNPARNGESSAIADPKTPQLMNNNTSRKRESPIKISEYLLTDDEDKDEETQNAIMEEDAPSNSTRPLNLAGSLTKRQQRVLRSFKCAAPLNLHKYKEKQQAITPRQKRLMKRHLNKAPRTPINGELFAKELKSNLARMTNNEILDLRKRNSMGGILSKIESLQLEEKLKEELVKRNFDIEALPPILSPPIEFVEEQRVQQHQQPPLTECEVIASKPATRANSLKINMPRIVPPPPSDVVTSPINILPPPPDFSHTPPFPIPKALTSDVNTTARNITTPKTKRNMLIRNSLENASINGFEQLSGDEKELCVTLQNPLTKKTSKNKPGTKRKTSSVSKKDKKQINNRETPINKKCDELLSQQDIVEQYINVSKKLKKSKTSNRKVELSNTKRSLYTEYSISENNYHNNDEELPTSSACLPQPPVEFMDVVFKKPAIPPRKNATKNKITKQSHNSQTNNELVTLTTTKTVSRKQKQAIDGNETDNENLSTSNLRRSQRTRVPAVDERLVFYTRKLQEYEERRAKLKLSASQRQSTLTTLNIHNKNRIATTKGRQRTSSSNFLGDTATTSNYTNNSGISMTGVTASSTLNTIEPHPPVLEPVQEETFATTSKTTVTTSKTTATTSSEKEVPIENDGNDKVKKQRKQYKKKNNIKSKPQNKKHNKKNNSNKNQDNTTQDKEKTNCHDNLQQKQPAIVHIDEAETEKLSKTIQSNLEHSRINNISVAHVEYINSIIEQFKAVDRNVLSTEAEAEATAVPIVNDAHAGDNDDDAAAETDPKKRKSVRVRLQRVNLCEHETQSNAKKTVDKTNKKSKKNNNYIKKKKNKIQQKQKSDNEQVADEQQHPEQNNVEEQDVVVKETAETTESVKLKHKLELLAWLKGINSQQPTNTTNSSYNDMFKELRCSAASKLKFSTLDGVDYAFYETEEQSCLGYLRFRPRQIKSSKRAKKYQLHFVVLSGEFKISTDKDVGNFSVGDMVAVLIGARYKIENVTEETALLMVIKK